MTPAQDRYLRRRSANDSLGGRAVTTRPSPSARVRKCLRRGNKAGSTEFAVLHGGVFPGGLGDRNVRGWFSTGDADSIRPTRMVERAAEEMRLKGFNRVEYRTFRGGHEVDSEEIEALVRWWLPS